MRRAALCLILALAAVLLTFSPVVSARKQDSPLKVTLVPQAGAQSPEEAKPVEDVPFIRVVGGNTLNVRTAGTVVNYQGGEPTLDPAKARAYAAEVAAAIRAERKKP